MTAAARKVEPAPQPDPRRWYIVATNSKQERTAVFHLRRLGVDAYVPLRSVKIVVPKKHIGAVPLFPRYVFIHVDPATAEWWAIRTAPGVKAVVSAGERPAALPHGFVETIKAHEVEGLVNPRKLIPVPPAEVGDQVRVDVGGTLFDAVIEERVDANRVRVLLSAVGGGKPMRVIARRAQLQS